MNSKLKIIRTSLLIVSLCAALSNAKAQYAEAFICNDSKVKSIELRSSTQNTQPIIQLNGSENILELHFDILESLPRNLTYTYVLADENWKANSNLNSAQFLNGFNESNNIDYDFSINTKVSYIHYFIRFPDNNIRPKLSGNYLLQILEDDKVLFQYPLFVVDQSVAISANLGLSNRLDNRQTHHQIQFQVSLGGNFPPSASQEITASIFQNFSKHVGIENIKPNNFNNEVLDFGIYGNISLPALNQYRAFDNVDLYNRSIRVASQNTNADTVQLTLYTDENLRRNDYLTLRDLNGRFIIANRQGYGPDTDADYCKVGFTYDSPFLPEQALVLDGKAFEFNDYTMQYYNNEKLYYKEMLLKQGFYNYRYAALSNNGANIQNQEGSYLQSENVYTIVIYRNAFGKRYQEILGIVNINSANKF